MQSLSWVTSASRDIVWPDKLNKQSSSSITSAGEMLMKIIIVHEFRTDSKLPGENFPTRGPDYHFIGPDYHFTSRPVC